MVYDKIYPVIKSHYLNDENEMIDQLKKMMNREDEIHFINNGCNKLFKSYQPSNQITDLMAKILKKKSPLEKIYLCKKVLDRINDELNDFLYEKHYSPFSKLKNESVMTDDLVAIIIYVLIKFNLKNLKQKSNLFLIGELSFMQTFSFYLHMQSAYGYALTTFEVAVNYIKDYHFEYNESPNKINESSNGQSSMKSLNGSIKSLKRKTSTSTSNETLNQSNSMRKDVRKQINFTSVKMNDDLEQIAKILEETSFSFKQLENVDKTDL